MSSIGATANVLASDNADYPPSVLSGKLVTVLNQNGICSPIQLLGESSYRLQQLTKLSFKEIAGIKEKLIEKLHSPLKLDVQPPQRCYSTGSAELDQLLNGGLWTGTLNEFLGYTGAGKSLLVHNILLHIISVEDDCDVLYVTRSELAAVASMKNILEMNSVDVKVAEYILNKVKMQCFATVDELSDILSHLDATRALFDTHKVLLLDNIASDCLLHYMELDCKFQHRMAGNVQMLRQLAVECNCLVLITSLVATRNEVGRPSHGNRIIDLSDKTWQSFMSNRFLLTKSHSRRRDHKWFELEVKVLKSRTLKTGNACVLSVSSQGLE